MYTSTVKSLVSYKMQDVTEFVYANNPKDVRHEIFAFYRQNIIGKGYVRQCCQIYLLSC